MENEHSHRDPEVGGSRFFDTAPDPERFEVSKGLLRIDRFMNRFIVIGGLGVILAVFGICIFIVAEVLPLFQSPSVEPLSEVATGIDDALLLGADEWTERPFVVTAGNQLHWVDPSDGSFTSEALDLPPEARITSWEYHQKEQIVVLGTSTGAFSFLTVNYKPVFAQDGSRSLTSSVKIGDPNKVGDGALTAISFYNGDSERAVATVEAGADETASRLEVATFKRKRSFFGGGDFAMAGKEDLSALLPHPASDVQFGGGGRDLIARLTDGSVAYLRLQGGTWELRQTFHPFPGEAIASMDFLQGEVSLNFTSESGRNVIFSLTPSPDSGLQFVETKELPTLARGATHFSTSVRNKAYLLTDGAELSLRYATTGKVRWSRELETPLIDVLLGGKYDRIVTLAADGTLDIASLHDPHPEAGLRAFFGKIWYEGQDEAKYSWQSTGGDDDFEPKLSLIPLIFGSLKGTFYALLFAIPIALLSAIYTSQFLHPSLKRVVKPTMEIMASLPSVVLGFLGALWLAPILETRVPSFLLMIVAVLLAAIFAGVLWNRLPKSTRLLLPQGAEFIVFLPLLLLVGFGAWEMGPFFERIFFTVTDPQTGHTVADFRLWWANLTGNQFQQRNSLIIGIMMGFAVIPIIFTIAEDALSNVPQNLVSGSLALGASRWQTTARVVLPSASAGIFSALMIGLGRAVGETMIVVMATGNTPIMDVDIFNGMRTLSANIAVELPEAPHGGTLYRTLFLGALVLFILTFVINTLAEFMRQRLRDRYKTIG
jgi:phosphate transport system permease protein